MYCVDCGISMSTKESDVEIYISNNNDEIYKMTKGDVLECEECGHQVLANIIGSGYMVDSDRTERIRDMADGNDRIYVIDNAL